MNWPNRIVSQRLMAATTSWRLPSLPGRSIARPEVGVRWGDGIRLAVHLGEVAVHVRELLDRLHDRVADQVGERDLAAAGALEVVVDDDPVVDHQLGRDGAHAGRRRHLQRRRHVLHDGGRGTAQHLHLVTLEGFRAAGALAGWLLGCLFGAFAAALGSGARRGLGLRGGRGGGAGAGWGGVWALRACRRLPVAARALRLGWLGGVVDQELMPTGVYRRGILAELAIHLLDQPLVLTEW